MTFTNLLTKRIVVARLTAVSGNRTNYSTVTAEYVDIQRMDEGKTLSVGGSIGKTFRLYAEEDTDIEVGDKLLETSTGYEYKVQSITTPANLGNFIHKEALIFKVK